MFTPKNQPIEDNAPSIEGGHINGVAAHTKRGVMVTLEESYEINPMEDALAAVADILTKYLLKTPDGNIYIKKSYETVPDDYKPFFRTIQQEAGQIDRLINTKSNGEGVVPLPGIFHHFIDMHWDVGTSSIGQCKATYRMKVVLNNLDIETYDTQMFVYRMAHAIILCLNEHVSEYSAFVNRFQLDYFDIMETWTKGVQYFWLQYSIHFRDYSTYQFRNYVEKHVVCPPFTNHSDQQPESNEDNHEDHKEVTYDDASGFHYPDPSENIPIRT